MSDKREIFTHSSSHHTLVSVVVYTPRLHLAEMKFTVGSKHDIRAGMERKVRSWNRQCLPDHLGGFKLG